MYKLLLILKYLRRKLAPLFAAMVVTLCTAMVIIVISVMGGFLDSLRESVRQLTGDVVVTAGSLTGFPRYDELIRELEQLPEVEKGTPTITSYGLIRIGQRSNPVQLQGIRADEFATVVPYGRTLHWTTRDMLADFDQRYAQFRGHPSFEQQREELAQIDLRDMGLTFDVPAAWQPEDGTPLRGIVPGIEVPKVHRRDADGQYQFSQSSVGQQATLTTLPLTQRGTIGAVEPRHSRFLIVNEIKSGHFEVDDMRVYMPFSELQRLLDMQAQQVWEQVDPQTLEPIGDPITLPGRATQVVLKAAAGYRPEQARDAAQKAAQRFMMQHEDMPLLYAMTWEEAHWTILQAVANEKGLVTFLFVIISIVAIVMVFLTFYNIVLEKTRDIGILRAVGASRTGITGMFLGYGLAIGLVGAALGYTLAHLVVNNLNEIQWWLGHRLGVSVYYLGWIVAAALLWAAINVVKLWFRGLSKRFAGWTLALFSIIALTFATLILLLQPDLAGQLNAGIAFQMWDPTIYVFDRIPARIDRWEAGMIVIGAVVSCVGGALVPAILAGLQDPIEALRYE